MNDGKDKELTVQMTRALVMGRLTREKGNKPGEDTAKTEVSPFGAPANLESPL
jgi:hypothetical protein